MSCCTGSQLTFISEDETPLAQTLGGATLGSGDQHRMGVDSQGLPVLQSGHQLGLLLQKSRGAGQGPGGGSQSNPHPRGPTSLPDSLPPSGLSRAEAARARKAARGLPCPACGAQPG